MAPETRFYESMREVSPGDIIFSFVDTRIGAIRVAQSYCWESPKEFGEAGQNWENMGVRVGFTTPLNKVRPKEHMDISSYGLAEPVFAASTRSKRLSLNAKSLPRISTLLNSLAVRMNSDPR